MPSLEQASFSLAVPGSLGGSRAFSFPGPKFFANKAFQPSMIQMDSPICYPIGRFMESIQVSAKGIMLIAVGNSVIGLVAEGTALAGPARSSAFTRSTNR